MVSPVQAVHPLPQRDKSSNFNNELIRACGRGDLIVINACLESGADINFQNEKGRTPLITAIEHHSFKIVDLLLENGADAERPQEVAHNLIPLIYASYIGDVRIIAVLVKKGNAMVNRTNRYGCTALFIACREGHAKAVSTLIQLGANVGLPVYNSCTPLTVACEKNRYEIARILIEEGKAGVNQRDGKGYSPIETISLYDVRAHHRLVNRAKASEEQSALIRLLVAKGACLVSVPPYYRRSYKQTFLDRTFVEKRSSALVRVIQAGVLDGYVKRTDNGKFQICPPGIDAWRKYDAPRYDRVRSAATKALDERVRERRKHFLRLQRPPAYRRVERSRGSLRIRGVLIRELPTRETKAFSQHPFILREKHQQN